jgi:hypothetical protein
VVSHERVEPTGSTTLIALWSFLIMLLSPSAFLILLSIAGELSTMYRATGPEGFVLVASLIPMGIMSLIFAIYVGNKISKTGGLGMGVVIWFCVLSSFLTFLVWASIGAGGFSLFWAAVPARLLGKLRWG